MFLQKFARAAENLAMPSPKASRSRKGLLAAMLLLPLPLSIGLFWYVLPSPPRVTIDVSINVQGERNSHEDTDSQPANIKQGGFVYPSLATISPDGRFLATVSLVGPYGNHQGPVRIWDTHTGEQQVAIEEDLTGVKGSQFSSDNRWFGAQVAGGLLKLWALPSGEEWLTLPLDNRRDDSINWQFSPTGQCVVIPQRRFEPRSVDLIQFWDVPSRQQRGEIQGDF